MRYLILMLGLWVGSDVWGQCTEYTVGSGKSYSTIQAAVADVGSGGCHKVILDSGLYAENVDIAGKTVDSLIIMCAAGQEHGFSFQAGCRVQSSANDHVIDVVSNNVRLRGIVFRYTGISAAYYAVRQSGSNFVHDRVLLFRNASGYGTSYSSAPTSGSWKNSFAWDSSNSSSNYGFFPSSNTTNVTIINCGAVGFKYGFHNAQAYNSWARTGTAAGSAAFQTISGSHLACNDNSCISVTGAVANLGAISNFGVVDSASGNFSIDTNSVLWQAGTDMLDDNPTDVYGVSWVSPMSIGPNNPTPEAEPEPPVEPCVQTLRINAIDIGGTGADTTNWPVLVEVDSSTRTCMQYSDDIRFADASGTALNAWLESTSHPFRFWVKIPTLPAAGASIRMYWGDSVSQVSQRDMFLVFPWAFSGARGMRGIVPATVRNWISNDTSNNEDWPNADMDIDGRICVSYRNDKGANAHGWDSSGYMAARCTADPDTGWGPEIVISDIPGIDERDGGALAVDSSGVPIFLFFISAQWDNAFHAGSPTDAVFLKKYYPRTGALSDTIRINTALSALADSSKYVRGRPFLGSDNKVRIGLYGYQPPNYPMYIFTSGTFPNPGWDATWQQKYISTNQPGVPISEMTIAEFAPGHFLSIARNDNVTGNKYYQYSRSTDYGAAWTAFADADGMFPTDTTSNPMDIRQCGAYWYAAAGYGVGMIWRTSDGYSWERLPPYWHSAVTTAGKLYPSLVCLDDSTLGIAAATNLQSAPFSSLFWLTYDTQYGPQHFEGRSFDTVTFANGGLRLAEPSTNSRSAYSVQRFNGAQTPLIFESSLKYKNGSRSSVFMTVNSASAENSQNYIGSLGAVNSFYAVRRADAYSQGIPTEDTPVKLKYLWTPDTIRIWEDAGAGYAAKLTKTAVDDSGVVDTAMNIYTRVNSTEADDAYTETYWQFTRPYSATEPTVAFGTDVVFIAPGGGRGVSKSMRGYRGKR